MKKIIFILLIIAGFKSFSQSVAINTTGNAANSSAMLDITANNKGLLIPRMSTTDRQAIASPANGLMVFDITTNSFWYFSTVWKEITSGGGGGFVLPYNGSGSTVDKLFSVTNSNTSVVGVAIYGKKSIGSGMSFGYTVGILGENSSGVGVQGLCDTGYGVMGASAKNHSVVGISYAAGYSGVYGLAYNMNTYGVMGETQNFYTAGIYGKAGNVGKAGLFEITDSSSADTTVLLRSVGTGVALNVQQNNPYNFKDALSVTTKGSGTALFAQSELGITGHFKKTNNNNTNEVVNVENTTTAGAGVSVDMTNGSGTGAGFALNHLGQGDGIYLTLTNPANDQYIVNGYSNGTGGGINVNLTNVVAAGDGLQISNQGTGYGLNISAKKGTTGRFYSYPGNNHSTFYLQNEGNSNTIEIFQTNTTNSNPAIFSSTKGTGASIEASTDGTGPGIQVDNNNASAVNSLATFRKNGANKARIDGTGKGFFNGGTQSSGADVAEVFDIMGNIHQYETGDVLVISLEQDRTVEKSSGAYSTLVAGVYATKPGVILTEENIDTDLTGKVPMGVVGVIPTKVCGEGGEIKRGDLLVTSSIPGVAMKGDPDKLKPGQVIGKALENFSSASVGKIKVLVNVK